MKKFCIDDYRSNGYAMHCDTNDKADVFLRYLDSCGRRWIRGGSYLIEDHWETYEEDTCYVFNTGQFGSCSNLQNTIFFYPDQWTILEFDDFIWDKHRSLDSQQLYEIWDKI